MNNKALESPMIKTWRRLKKNKPAVISLCVILVAIFLAVFAPLVAPDSTPDANDQVLELANMPPGYSTQMLMMRKDRDEKPIGILHKIFRGGENPYTMVPINGYTIKGSQLIAKVYKGTLLPPADESFNIADIAFSNSITNKTIIEKDGYISFTNFKEEKVRMPIAEIQQLVKENNIVTKKYYLGTDGYGRDILSRLIFGVRVSISVGFVAVFISLTIGISLGAMAGYYRGKIDNFIMWFINVVWSIPTILLAMAISFALGNRIDSFWIIYIAVGLSMWVEVARIVRGQVMGVREMEYIQAARGLGYNDFRIITKHVLPNIIGPIMVITASDFASAILIEAGLSMVGIGVRPPMPSWGIMLNEQHNYLFTEGKAFLALAPGLCIMVLVLAFNLLGNGLRDAFDVKGKLQ
jgi:ABC-type dipeptide/oligopeptide/nickel transport system permease subunit